MGYYFVHLLVQTYSEKIISLFTYKGDIQSVYCSDCTNFYEVYCIPARLDSAYPSAVELGRALFYSGSSMWSGMFSGTNGPTATSSSTGSSRAAFQSGPGVAGVPTRSRAPVLTLNKQK